MANWQSAKLLESKMVAREVKALKFSASSWVKHESGQHYDIRLTSEGGYQAERSYSVASPPEERGIVEFGIQLLKNGEVSPYLFELKPGEEIEIRGPIGGHFVWNVQMPGPLVLIGGGSGMVPLMCMLRHHENNLAFSKREVIFLVSARTIDHVLYREELERATEKDLRLKVVFTITDSPPSDWGGYKRRIDREMLREVLGHLIGKTPMIYVCGPTPFVEAAAKNLVILGFNSHEVRTERFGG